MYNETCLERPHVRTVAQGMWLMATGEINTSYRGLAIKLSEFSETTPISM